MERRGWRRGRVSRYFLGAVLGLAGCLPGGMIGLWIYSYQPLPEHLETCYALFWSAGDAAELRRLRADLSGPKRSPPAELHLKLGNLFYKHRLIPHARRHYMRVLEFQPGRPAAVFNIARTYERDREFKQALVYYEKAAELEPGDHRAFSSIGRICLNETDRIPCAIRAFSRVTELEPRHLKARIELGRALLRDDQHSAAAAEWATALKIDPTNVDVRWYRANLYSSVGQHADALREYKEYLKTERAIRIFTCVWPGPAPGWKKREMRSIITMKPAC